MFKRPIWTAACLYLAFLLIRYYSDPSFLLGNYPEVSELTAFAANDQFTVEGIVTSFAYKETGAVFILSDVTLFHSSRHIKLPDVQVFCRETDISESLCGMSVQAEGYLRQFDEATNPGEFDYRRYQAIRGIGYEMTDPVLHIREPSGLKWRSFVERIRSRVRWRINRVYPQEAAGLTAALILGDRSLMSDETSLLWRRSGIAHMLAISGMHLMLIGMGLFRMLRRLGSGMKLSAGISAGVLTLYTFLVGAPVSAVRALIMFIYGMGARLSGEKSDGRNAMALALLLILIGNPGSVLDPGFQLSFCAVFTLTFFAGKGPFQGALMLYLLPVPLILYHYGELPVLGIFFNLLLVPLMPAAFGCAAAGTVLGSIFTYPAVFIFRFYNTFLDFFNSKMNLTFIFGRPEIGQILLYYVMLGAGIFLFKKWVHLKKRFLLLLGIPFMLMVFLKMPPREMTVTMLDVGQGECCVIQLPSGVTILSDGGSSSVNEVGSRRILPYLTMKGIRRLDYVLVSHDDLDHISGISEVLEAAVKHETSLKIGTLYLPYRNEPSETFQKMASLSEMNGTGVCYLDRGDEAWIDAESVLPIRIYAGIQGGSGKVLSRARCGIKILSPDKADAFDNENDASLVYLLTYGDFDMLFTGDLSEEERLVQDLKRISEELLQNGEAQISIEVLKAGHHGSRFSSSRDLLEEVGPSVTLISAGRFNRYGHPHQETLDRLADAGSQVYRTDRDGAITVCTDGRYFRVSVFCACDE